MLLLFFFYDIREQKRSFQPGSGSAEAILTESNNTDSTQNTRSDGGNRERDVLCPRSRRGCRWGERHLVELTPRERASERADPRCRLDSPFLSCHENPPLDVTRHQALLALLCDSTPPVLFLLSQLVPEVPWEVRNERRRRRKHCAAPFPFAPPLYDSSGGSHRENVFIRRETPSSPPNKKKKKMKVKSWIKKVRFAASQ